MQCLFLYFGLSFTAERRIIEVCSVTPTIPLSNTYISDTMLKLIREEQELMKHNMKGRKGDKQDVAEFTQIKPGLFVFCSNFHFSMSKINILTMTFAHNFHLTSSEINAEVMESFIYVYNDLHKRTLHHAHYIIAKHIKACG